MRGGGLAGGAAGERRQHLLGCFSSIQLLVQSSSLHKHMRAFGASYISYGGWARRGEAKERLCMQTVFRGYVFLVYNFTCHIAGMVGETGEATERLCRQTVFRENVFLVDNFTCHITGMVGETGEATERFLRSAAKGEVDAHAARRRNAETAKQRAAEPPPSQVSAASDQGGKLIGNCKGECLLGRWPRTRRRDAP